MSLPSASDSSPAETPTFNNSFVKRMFAAAEEEFAAAGEEHIERLTDPSWRTGDFLLVSADGYRFRLPSVQLFAASPVFHAAHDASNAAGDKVVHFTDSTIETAEVLRSVLLLMTSSELDHVQRDTMEWCEHLANVVAFLKKYECDRTLQALLHFYHYRYLSGDWVTRNHALSGLVLGTLADDIIYCTNVIAIYNMKLQTPMGVFADATAEVQKNEPRTHGRNAQPTNVLLPANMSLTIHRLIPPDYIWALSRSWLVANQSLGSWAYEFSSFAHKTLRPKPTPAATRKAPATAC